MLEKMSTKKGTSHEEWSAATEGGRTKADEGTESKTVSETTTSQKTERNNNIENNIAETGNLIVRRLPRGL